MKIIDASCNKKYATYKLATTLLISAVYMLQIYFYNPTEKNENIPFVLAYFVLLYLVNQHRKTFHKVVRPLLFNQNNNDEYRKDLMNYVTKNTLVINIELLTLLLIISLDLLSLFSPFVFYSTVHNHQFLPIALIISGIVYKYNVESYLDKIYAKYYREEYLEYMKIFYK